MILRKRAWDIMREDFITMDNTASVLDAMRGMAKHSAGCLAVAVMGESGEFKGIVSSWDIVKFIAAALPPDEALDVADRGLEGGVGQHCKKCGTTAVVELISGKCPRVAPSEPFPGVMDAMLRSKQRIAVVCEGNRVMGMISLSDVFNELSAGMVNGE